MALPINILQSLISRNRSKLNSYHCMEYQSAIMRDYYTKHSIEGAEVEHACVVHAKKQIAKLVVVQKALKKELSKLIETQRLRKEYMKIAQDYRMEVMERVGEVV